MNISEHVKIVEAIAPQVGAAITGDYISLKKAGHVTVLVHVAQGHADPVAISIEQATAVAGTGSKPLANAVPIYLVADAATSDAWVRQDDDVEYTTSATLKHKLVAFEIDASALDVAGGFDCVCVKTAASNALNVTSAVYLLSDLRYGVGASAIVD
ncbi:hypothetical protein [Desulfomicrobium escambiense]|uniref:hypothetical protein n=1 Tax=Desulfomicrobium escambiense TaxID=29503 RepID=UPI0003F4E332|nr:hypothetical protein [Desulfomicrobium escambiense]